MNDADPFTVPQLDVLILQAIQLGFADDVRYWKAMRQRVLERERSDASS